MDSTTTKRQRISKPFTWPRLKIQSPIMIKILLIIVFLIMYVATIILNLVTKTALEPLTNALFIGAELVVLFVPNK